jgi:predicted O-methyltransferase YrrM
MSQENSKPKAKKTTKAKKVIKPVEATEQPANINEAQPVEATLTRHEWSAEDEVGTLLAALIKCHKATNVLELGTFEGYTTKYLIDAVNENGGKLITVDIEDKVNESIKTQLEANGHQFIKGSSLDVCKRLNRNSFDLIYIDTVHEWYHALPEFKILEHLVKQGGILVYHDTMKFPDMKRLANYVKAFRFQSVTIRTPEGNGLSIIQK